MIIIDCDRVKCRHFCIWFLSSLFLLTYIFWGIVSINAVNGYYTVSLMTQHFCHYKDAQIQTNYESNTYNSIDIKNVLVRIPNETSANETTAIYVTVHFPPPGKWFVTEKQGNQWLSKFPFNKTYEENLCFCPSLGNHTQCYQNLINILPWSISLGLFLLIFLCLIYFLYVVLCVFPKALNWHGG